MDNGTRTPILKWRSAWDSGTAPSYAPIAPPPHPTFDLDRIVAVALEEDSAGIGDVTTLSTISDSTQATAKFLAKADGVLAGLFVAERVFAVVDPSVQIHWTHKDGDAVTTGTTFGQVRGSARSVLLGERIALNFMQRMSGIATATRAMVLAVKGFPARILETRKTVPGMRVLDKWAVLIGGGSNHRIGLFDMVMIKNNHIAAAGGVQAAIRCCQEYVQEHRVDVPIEVETRTLDELKQLLALVRSDAGIRVDRVMLDNMTRLDASKPGGVDVTMLRSAMALIGHTPVETEASGNVTLQTAREIASTGVAFISCGALTHSVTALDISLRIHEELSPV